MSTSSISSSAPVASTSNETTGSNPLLDAIQIKRNTSREKLYELAITNAPLEKDSEVLSARQIRFRLERSRLKAVADRIVAIARKNKQILSASPSSNTSIKDLVNKEKAKKIRESLAENKSDTD